MSKETMLEKKVWAVIGANQNPEKFGNKIYNRLKEKGYEVYPVNPVVESIDGDICYKNLSSLPKTPDVINMVVAPDKGKPYIEEAAELGIKYVWFQPGTIDREILNLAKEKGIEALQACVLVATENK
ncbi:MAG: CoA-binding protein [Clostridiales bacterium]|nr:CoA-binding protein [Clostridiales bacterium]